MQEPDNFHFHCFQKNTAKVFNHASVNKVLTKYSKPINRVLATHALKYALVSLQSIYWFLHENRSPYHNAESPSTRNILNLSRYCIQKFGSLQNNRRMLFVFLVLTVTR